MTRLAIKRPIGLLMCVLIIVVFGVVSLTSMPVDLISDINMPITVVYTTYPGASPKEVESLVTTVMEKNLSTVSGLKTLSSSSAENISVITMEFDYDVDLDKIMLEIREKVDGTRGSLPSDVGSPVVMQVNVNEAPVCTVAVTAADSTALLSKVKEHVVPNLEKINGVASVDASGGRESEIRVELAPEKLAMYGLTQASVAQLIGASNINLPVGSLEYGNKDMLIRGEYKFKSAEELKKLPLVTPKGAVITLADVATVTEGDKEPESLARLNGEECVLLSVNKQQSGNTLSISADVEKAVGHIASSTDFSLVVVNNQGDLIRDSVTNVASTFMVGAALAILVLWLILGDFKLSMIVATAIPVSVVATFVLMYFTGMTLNIISLGGLVMGVGMMVDNSIVVLESLFTAKSEGRSHFEAAIVGTKQVAGAITASTLTTVAVFLPIVFITGLAKELFNQAALTVSFSMIASLVSALTLVPCLFVVLKPKTGGGKASNAVFGALATSYGKSIEKVVRFKLLTIGAAVVLLMLSVLLVPYIGTALLAPMDQGEITVVINTESGTAISVVDEISKSAEAVLSEKEDIADYFASVGGAVKFSTADRNKSTINVLLRDDRKLSTAEMVQILRADFENFTNCEISVSPVDSMVTSIMGGGSSMDTGISVDVSGPDTVSLNVAKEMLLSTMRLVDGVLKASASNETGVPEARIEVNAIKAASYGLAPASILSAARYAITGMEVATISRNDVDVPVVLSYPKSMFKTLYDIETLPLATPMGGDIPLREVAEIVEDVGATAISRKGNERILTITAQVDSDKQSSAMATFKAESAKLDLPAGCEISFGGQEMIKNEAFSGLTKALLLSLMLVFMIMAAQFESARFSFVVIISVPLAFIGAASGLIISGDTLNIASFIGIIMLVGIVVNNAIVLIDRAGQEKEVLIDEAIQSRGGDPALSKPELKEVGRKAIILAGKSRLRPIIMTTVTTVLGLLPLALGLSSGTEILTPMAVVVIGGLLSSTLLTLFVIPCMYLLVNRK